MSFFYYLARPGPQSDNGFIEPRGNARPVTPGTRWNFPGLIKRVSKWIGRNWPKFKKVHNIFHEHRPHFNDPNLVGYKPNWDDLNSKPSWTRPSNFGSEGNQPPIAPDSNQRKLKPGLIDPNENDVSPNLNDPNQELDQGNPDSIPDEPSYPDPSENEPESNPDLDPDNNIEPTEDENDPSWSFRNQGGRQSETDARGNVRKPRRTFSGNRRRPSWVNTSGNDRRPSWSRPTWNIPSAGGSRPSGSNISPARANLGRSLTETTTMPRLDKWKFLM